MDSKHSKASRIWSYCRLAIAALIIFMFTTWNESKAPQNHRSDFTCPIEHPTLTQLQLLKSTRSRLERHGLSGLILLNSSPEVLREDSDMELPGWRQTSNIYYVAGKLEIRNVIVLVNATTSPLSFSLFLPELSERDVIFSGAVVDESEIKRLHGFANIYKMGDLREFAAKGYNFTTTSKHFSESSMKDIGVEVAYDQLAEELFIESRFRKTPEELFYLKFASQVAAYSHSVIEKVIENANNYHINEASLASYFNHLSTVCYCRQQSYSAIVGNGFHGSVLHFPTGQTPDDGYGKIGRKDLILIDAANAYRGYASDLTRTYSRTNSNRMKVLTAIVKDAQTVGLNSYVMGNTWGFVVKKTFDKVTEGLWKAGFLISDDLQTLIDSGVTAIFLPHGIGHPVGLEVHDPYPVKTSVAGTAPNSNSILNMANFSKSQSLIDQYPLKLSNEYVLNKGHVSTIEPGVYFIEYCLELAKEEKLGVKHLINWELVELYRGVGGVRIEDVIAIGHDGLPYILTSL